MKENFFKFPSTPHLATLEGVDVRDDKVFSSSERSDFLHQYLTIEEKIDGANLGISFDAAGNVLAQNRGSYLQLPGQGQWKKLSDWLSPRLDTLFDHLADQFILFGEWCYAQHSIFYDHLPDWFLAFDLYDKQAGRFLASDRRDILFQAMNIAHTPFIAEGHFTFADIMELFNTSNFGNLPAEGLYLRYNKGNWLEQRAKLVRTGFIQAQEEHWSRSAIKPNRVQMVV